MDLGISDKLKPILEEVKQFIDIEILPLEHEYHQEVVKGDRWAFTERQTEILETLKAKARAKPVVSPASLPTQAPGHAQGQGPVDGPA